MVQIKSQTAPNQSPLIVRVVTKVVSPKIRDCRSQGAYCELRLIVVFFIGRICDVRLNSPIDRYLIRAANLYSKV